MKEGKSHCNAVFIAIKMRNAETKRREEGDRVDEKGVKIWRRCKKGRKKRKMREHTESHRNDNIKYYFVCELGEARERERAPSQQTITIH